MRRCSLRRYGFQLYQSDPSGNYNGWKATCIGANNQSAMSLMKQEYKDEGLQWELIGYKDNSDV